MSNNIGKALGTVAIWGGVVALCYVLGELDLLNGVGAGVMFAVVAVLTGDIWSKN